MRDKPEYLQNPTESQIMFNPMDFGYTDASFDMICINHGDRDSFRWLAGGGEYTYSVTRMDRGRAIDDGTPCSVWLFEETSVSDNTKRTIIVDTPNLELLTVEHKPAPFEDVSHLSDAVIDLGCESMDRNRTVPNLFFPAGGESVVILPSYSYEEGDGVG